jgi:hypothetical protein
MFGLGCNTRGASGAGQQEAKVKPPVLCGRQSWMSGLGRMGSRRRPGLKAGGLAREEVYVYASFGGWVWAEERRGQTK